MTWWHLDALYCWWQRFGNRLRSSWFRHSLGFIHAYWRRISFINSHREEDSFGSFGYGIWFLYEVYIACVAAFEAKALNCPPIDFYFLWKGWVWVFPTGHHYHVARLGVVSSLLLVCYDAVVEVDEDLNLIEHSQQSLWIELGISEGQRFGTDVGHLHKVGS